MAKQRTYYTLAQRIDGKWTPQFGDYDRETVAAEIADYADNGTAKRKDMRIVASGDKQADIVAKLAALNGGAV